MKQQSGEYPQTLVNHSTGGKQDIYLTIKTLVQDSTTECIQLLHFSSSFSAFKAAGIFDTDAQVQILLVKPQGCSQEDAKKLLNVCRKRHNIAIRVLDWHQSEQAAHTKLCLFLGDGPGHAIIGSANFSCSAHGLAKKSNIELSVLLDANASYRSHFDRLWEKASGDWNALDFMPLAALTLPGESSAFYQLLDYQQEAVDRLGKLYQRRVSGNQPRGAMLSLPTGSGKTLTVLRFLADYVFIPEASGLPVLWLSHRTELNAQARNAAERLFQECRPGLVVQSENSLMSKPKSAQDISDVHLLFNTPGVEMSTPLAGEYSAIVVDEAHHGTGEGQQTMDVLDRHANTFRVGISATPYRNDSTSVLRVFGGNLVPSTSPKRKELEDYNDSRFGRVQVLAKTPKSHRISVETDFELNMRWDEASLANKANEPLNTFNNKIANKAVAEAWDQSYGSTLVFAISIEHANKLGAQFRNAHPDTPLQIVHGGKIAKGLELIIEPQQTSRFLNINDRERIRRSFLNKDIEVLISVDMYIAGIDFPHVETIFMSRPTFSSITYNQIIGRGLRGPQFKGTEFLRVVDFCDQGKMHAESTKYLMDLRKAQACTDQNDMIEVEARILGLRPRVRNVQSASLPSKAGYWSVYSPKGGTIQRDWRWGYAPPDNIAAQFERAERSNRSWTKDSWLVFYIFDDIIGLPHFKQVMKSQPLRDQIEKKAEERLDVLIAKA